MGKLLKDYSVIFLYFKLKKGWGKGGEKMLIILGVADNVVFRPKWRRYKNNVWVFLYNIFISWKTGILSFEPLYEKMDNLKIHDSRFTNRNLESKVQNLLDSKIEDASLATEEDSNASLPPKKKPKKLIPSYSFLFKNYKVGDSV